MRAFVTASLREAQVVVAAGIGDPGEAKAATWSNVQNREAPKRTDGDQRSQPQRIQRSRRPMATARSS